MLRKIKDNFKLMWMISCVVILVIPVIINSIVNIYMTGALKTETVFSNELIVNQVQRELENTQDVIFKMKAELLSNQDVLNLSTRIGDTKQYQYDINAVYQELMVYRTSLENISHYYIYFPNIDTIISSKGVYSPEKFYQKYYSGTALSEEAWRSELGIESNGRFISGSRVMEDGNIGRCMFYYCNLKLIGQVGTPVLCVSVDQSYLQNILSNTEVNETEMVFILDGENNFLLGNELSDQLDTTWLKSLDLSEDRENYSIKYNGRTSELNYCTGTRLNWKYAKLSIAQEFWRQTNLTTAISIGSIILSLILGSACIWGIIRINYAPMQRILALFRNAGTEKEKSGGEYRYLEKSVKDVISQKEGAVEEIERQKRTLQEFFLVRLLKGETGNIPSVEEAAENAGFTFVSQKFVVIAFYIEDYETLFADDDIMENQREDLAHFILINILEELFNQDNYAKMAVIDHIPVLLLNFSESNRTEWRQTVKRQLDYAHEFIRQHFDLHFREGISDICSGFENLHQAYTQALEVVEYRVLLDTDTVEFYGDMPKADYSGGYRYGYSAESEHKLIVAIQNGNSFDAEEALNEIFDSVMSEKEVDPNIVKYFLFDIGSTMLKAISELYTERQEKHFEQIDYVQQLITGNSIPKIQDGLRQLLRTLCREQKTEKQGEEKISDKVKRYIRENYKDPNLNVTAVGPVFGFVPKYLSKKFKEETGFGLLEYINNVRIEEAKRLITGTNLKFEEIAEQIGYTNLNTFMRVFKKSVGTTPGKYREEN